MLIIFGSRNLIGSTESDSGPYRSSCQKIQILIAFRHHARSSRSKLAELLLNFVWFTFLTIIQLHSFFDMAHSHVTTAYNIVIVGGSFAALAVAHTLLRDTLPRLSSTRTYKVYLISPNSQFFWRPAAPRIIVNPAALSEKQAFFDFADGFKKYGESSFEHVKAYATSVDPSKQVVLHSPDLETPSLSIHYDSLVLASGTSFKDPMWSLQSGEDVTKKALKKMQKQIPAASSIAIIGGGPLGTETAGELGHLYGGSKEISLFSGSARLLHRLQDQRLGQDAETRLSRFGVKLIHNLRCEDTELTGENKTRMKLSDGTETTVDVVIEATGEVPCNQFIPKDWLNNDGLVRTVIPTLRVDVPDLKNVYAIGSVSDALKGGILGIVFSYKALCESIHDDIAGRGKLLFLLRHLQFLPKTKAVFRRRTEAQKSIQTAGERRSTCADWS